VETGRDVSKTLSSCQLSECHADELVETSEGSSSEVSLVSLNASLKSTAREEVHELREDESALVHALPLSCEKGRMDQFLAEIDIAFYFL
jgi:hypothetical protein